MATNWNQFELLVREYISPAVRNLEFEDDDPSWNIMSTMAAETTAGVREISSGSYPAGYEARYRIKIQSAGRVAGGTFGGNAATNVGIDNHLFVGQGANAKYLDPRYTPQRSYVPITMTLKRIKGQITINHEQIEADLMASPLEEVASGFVEDVVKKHRDYVINGLYGDGTPTLAQVNNVAGYTLQEGVQTKVTIDNGTYARFNMGDLVVFGTDASPRVQIIGAGTLGRGYARVVDIDPKNRQIALEPEPGEGNIALVDNAHIMLADTYDFTAASTAAGSLVTQGYESLLIDSGVFPGSATPKFSSGLNVTSHSYLKSWVDGSFSSMVDPTMEAFTLVLDEMMNINVAPPPVCIAERGIWSLWSQLDKENNSLVLVPQGQTYQAAGGVSGPMMSHMEWKPTKFSSIRVRPNEVLGINPSTWMKFMPMGNNTVHWVASNGPMANMGSIFLPVNDGMQLTELAQANFNAYCEFGCLNPRANFRKIGIKAQRDV